jgi:hypothetical protein
MVGTVCRERRRGLGYLRRRMGNWGIAGMWNEQKMQEEGIGSYREKERMRVE